MYLLDTHVLLWALFEENKLPIAVKKLIDTNPRYVSIASLWEMAIKNSLGKLALPCSLEETARFCQDNDIKILPIEPIDCDEIRTLPFIHKDPFDRIIIAQARTKSLTIITKDAFIPQYDVLTAWEK